MKLFKVSVLLSIAAAVFAGALLFMTSQKVQQQEDRLAALRNASRQEVAHIRVLRAEWDYLNRPDRLEKLVSDHMGMDVVESGAVITDVNHVPEPLMIAPPSRKPQFFAQPVSMGGSSDEDEQEQNIDAPTTTPLPVREEQNFNKLLGKLKKGGADE